MRAPHWDPLLTWGRGAWLPRLALAMPWLAIGLLPALGAGEPALGATPVGSEFQINTDTSGCQLGPSVALDADGNFVVVWESDTSASGHDWDRFIQGQRYDASGNAVGSEFQVNTYTTGDQRRASVAVDADGNFVVVWDSYGSASSDTSGWSIQGQRYDASGNAVGSEFQVNTYTTGYQQAPRVAVQADGDFVVVWKSDPRTGPFDETSIQGQRYDASGSAVGSEFQINTYTTGAQGRPSVAFDADGNFVVVWQSEGSAGSDHDRYSVQGQRYDASGNASGSEFQVNTYTTSQQWGASVAADADGGFVVVWQSGGSADGDTDAHSIQGQRYDANGNAVGSQFQINTYTTSDQSAPSVAVQADGDFVVVWQSYGSAGSDSSYFSVQGQRYDASGSAVGSEFQVNTYTTSYQWGPSVAVEANGDFVVAWFSEGSAGSDTDCYSIQGQRYSVQAPRVPSLALPGMLGLALLLLGIATAALRGRLRERA